MIPCFLLEPTGDAYPELGRMETGECAARPGPHSTHVARWLGERGRDDGAKLWPADEDPRWPTACECGFAFTEDSRRFGGRVAIFCRSDTGEELTLRDAPAGAMWYADWYADQFESWDRSKPWHIHPGPDGRVLCVRTPGGDWIVDSRASNCTLPDDNDHACWVRTGTPPNVTAGKDGPTCSAGAGSIQCGSYHGFLREGALTDA